MTNLTPQQILQIRLQDACRYARLLRQNGGHPEAVIFVIRGIWGDEVANIVESVLDDAAQGEQSAESLQQTPPS